MFECSAYIPDMSCQESRRVRHRLRRARYEARQRAGNADFATETTVMFGNFYSARRVDRRCTAAGVMPPIKQHPGEAR